MRDSVGGFSGVAVSEQTNALGQHTRAGLEDNLWDVKKGVRVSTLQMIQKQINMANELGRPIATADQTRQMLKIGVTYKSTEETLENLGLPPNRKDGNKAPRSTRARRATRFSGRSRAAPRWQFIRAASARPFSWRK